VKLSNTADSFSSQGPVYTFSPFVNIRAVQNLTIYVMSTAVLTKLGLRLFANLKQIMV
jgi:hypothetical protein